MQQALQRQPLHGPEVSPVGEIQWCVVPSSKPRPDSSVLPVLCVPFNEGKALKPDSECKIHIGR